MLEDNPYISIVIPTFNREDTLGRAILSVMAQDYSKYELIIIDDGSSDNTKSIVDELSNEYPQIKYFYQGNLGVSSARNKGVFLSKGEWVAFLDSDDEWHPDKLSRQIQILKENAEHVCIHGEELWIRNGVRVNKMKKHKKGGGDQFIPSLYLCLISPSTVVIKKEIFESLGGFNEDYKVCEDYDLWLKLTSLYEVGFVETPVINKYGGHLDQLSIKYFAMDYYRIKSIDWILKNRQLKKKDREQAINLLIQKAKRLLNGYIKHDNLKDYPEIKKILDCY